jgi:aerobic-type carbon monoxide dehydrogenase small subunit (CoxS/CutS family)
MAFASRIEGKVERPAPVSFTLDGRSVSGVPGESLAVALLVAGIKDLRSSVLAGARRGVFCMMGVCQECLVRVDGRSVAACLEPVRAGMDVELIASPGSAHG